MKVVIAFRPIKWMFLSNWYSLYRWSHPTEYYGLTYKLIDIGILTIGYSRNSNPKSNL